jgi:hypothetical protein
MQSIFHNNRFARISYCWQLHRLRNSAIHHKSTSVSIVSGYGLDDRTIKFQSQGEVKGYFRQPLCPDRLWGPGVLCPGLKCCQGVTMTTHPHLALRSRMSRSYTFSPQASLWHVVGQLSAIHKKHLL